MRYDVTGENLSEKEIQEMIQEADGNGDGEIDFFGEFPPQTIIIAGA